MNFSTWRETCKKEQKHVQLQFGDNNSMGGQILGSHKSNQNQFLKTKDDITSQYGCATPSNASDQDQAHDLELDNWGLM